MGNHPILPTPALVVSSVTCAEPMGDRPPSGPTAYVDADTTRVLETGGEQGQSSTWQDAWAATVAAWEILLSTQRSEQLENESE